MTEREHIGLSELEMVLDEVFRDRERVTRREVYGRASEHLHLPADILAHLNELPIGPYTRAELTEAVNDVIRERGEQNSLGLLRMPG
ncbi:hypothetical protein [Spongiactinospora sp. TRM90649]|uniref:hypothetical protein n=1 Tax=Spongiactinospora sp. TRM90649 TaxID=3031114 RepID=UPI0023FA2432|nr:hypothetical protein [Spongiactinospora sp. TRM90649]MDF5757097.1 hypothetical protein [Spongiactinospora sp. TRM90649]